MKWDFLILVNVMNFVMRDSKKIFDGQEGEHLKNLKQKENNINIKISGKMFKG